ncbi:MAG: flagellar hook-length control protein FliK [Pseudomonadota bacterium]
MTDTVQISVQHSANTAAASPRATKPDSGVDVDGQDDTRDFANYVRQDEAIGSSPPADAAVADTGDTDLKADPPEQEGPDDLSTVPSPQDDTGALPPLKGDQIEEPDTGNAASDTVVGRSDTSGVAVPAQRRAAPGPVPQAAHIAASPGSALAPGSLPDPQVTPEAGKRKQGASAVLITDWLASDASRVQLAPKGQGQVVHMPVGTAEFAERGGAGNGWRNVATDHDAAARHMYPEPTTSAANAQNAGRALTGTAEVADLRVGIALRDSSGAGGDAGVPRAVSEADETANGPRVRHTDGPLPQPSGAVSDARSAPASPGQTAVPVVGTSPDVPTSPRDGASIVGLDLTRAETEATDLRFRSELQTLTRGPAATASASVDLPRHVAQQIGFAFSNQGGRVTDLALSPAELGNVRISLNSGDAGLVVAIQAERQETLDLMRRSAAELASEFSELGYGTVEFSFGTQTSGRSPDQSGDGAVPSGAGSSHAKEPETDPSVIGPRPAPVWLDRVDIRV